MKFMLAKYIITVIGKMSFTVALPNMSNDQCNHGDRLVTTYSIAEISVRYCTTLKLKTSKKFDGMLFITFLHYLKRKRITVRDYTLYGMGRA